MGAPPNFDETNRLPDCFAYIDKLARFGSNYSPGKLAISASAGGYGNTHYFLDDEKRYYFQDNTNEVPVYGGFITNVYSGLLRMGLSPSLINYVPSTSEFYRHGTNLAGYMSWGFYGWFTSYPWYNGRVRFTGNSEWYIMATAESFNGILGSGGHGDYAEWFWHDAFGRPNHQATPVGAVAHVEEPGLDHINDGTTYFGLWQRGKFFAICAWDSQRTPFLLVVGDPFVRR